MRGLKRIRRLIEIMKTVDAAVEADNAFEAAKPVEGGGILGTTEIPKAERRDFFK